MLSFKNIVGVLVGGLLFVSFLFTGCTKKPNPSTVVIYPEIKNLLLTPIEGKAPLVVTFEVELKNVEVEGYSLDWDFNGDGTVDRETQLNDTIQKWKYEKPGDYVVIVSVVKNGKVVSQRKGLVRVKKNLPPRISYFQVTPQQGRIPLKVILRLGAVDPDPLPGSGGIKKTEFDVNGDGIPDIVSNGLLGQTTYLYRTPGVYRVTARVYDDQNASAVAGPVTVSVFLPPPTTANPAKQIWHGGGGWAYEVTTAMEGKFLLADGYEGLKIFNFSSFPLSITLVDFRLSYLDAQVVGVKILKNKKVIALLDNSEGIYAAPLSGGNIGKFYQVIGGSIPFIKKFSYKNLDWVAGINETSYTLDLVNVDDRGGLQLITYPLKYYINYLQNNGAPAVCTMPDLTDILYTKDALLLVMKHCVWELNINAVVKGKYSMSYLFYKKIPVLPDREIGNVVEFNDKLVMESNFGIEIFKYYPNSTTLLTFIREIPSGYAVSTLLPDTFFGIYSKDITTVTFLQSIGEGMNIFYSLKITNLSPVNVKHIDYGGIIINISRINDFRVLSVGKRGILFEKDDWLFKKEFPVNEHLEGIGLADLKNLKLLITTSGLSGYSIFNVDDFSSPVFVYNKADYHTSFNEIAINGRFGWLITESTGSAFINRIEVVSSAPFIKVEWNRKIADILKGESYEFFPLGTSKSVGLKINGGYEIYSTLVTSGEKNFIKIPVETNGMLLLKDTLFLSDPMASIYFFNLANLYDGDSNFEGFYDLNIDGRVITPVIIGGTIWKGNKIILVGGGNRKLYGFTYDSQHKTLLLRDGYPLFSDTSLYSPYIVFRDIDVLGPYAFISMGKGGFSIINFVNTGILSYEEGILTVKSIVYPDYSDNVKLITRGYYSSLSNIDNPDLIRFLEISGLTYQP